MKMEKRTRATFSDNILDISLPEKWEDLSQNELLFILELVSRSMTMNRQDIVVCTFLFITGIRILEREPNSYKCRVRVRLESGKDKWIYFRMTPSEVYCYTDCLYFIFEPGIVPVRLKKWFGSEAVDANLHGLTFGEYLRLENLYQGYLSGQNEEAVRAMAGILYPGYDESRFTPAFSLNILQWMVQVKGMFAGMWHNFFKPSAGSSAAPDMLEIMNNEIRALTGGDVTKEEVILEIDCWRALTELDFKAKEAEEYNKQIKAAKR